MIKQRIEYLDSARGMASLSVLIFHSVLAFGSTDMYMGGINFFFEKYFDLGKIAVIVFFLISGFVIPFSIKGEDKLKAIKGFIISRFFRLYPVYWLSVLMGYFIIGNVSSLEFIVNFTMLQQFLGFKNIIGLYWTLQIEMIFYFLVVLVFILNWLGNIKKEFILSLVFLFLALVMAYFRFELDIKLPVAIPLSLSLMFFGAYYRTLALFDNPKAEKLTKIYCLLYFILIPIICVLGYNKEMGFNESWYKYTITYFSGITLFFLIGKYRPSNFYTEYLGKISYSLYLFHPIIIYILQKIDFEIPLNGYLKLIITLIITILFSHYSYAFIENPSINYGKKFKKILSK